MEREASLCCALFKALSLDPVPVIGNAIYVPRAEGFDLSQLDAVTPCPVHRYNFRHAVEMLFRHASENKRCRCERRVAEHRPEEYSDSLTADRLKVSGGGVVRGPNAKRRPQKGVLWAYEMNTVATAYRWLLENRSRAYAKCCEAVIVYQLERSPSLPPGLYVYRTLPRHFGCTAERPVAVVEQFNFAGGTEHAGLPRAIAIEAFPGRDSMSCMYVVSRRLALSAGKGSFVPEYSNRIFGEATALGILESCPASGATACEHHEVAMRTDSVCVLDLRWRGLHTKSSCVAAVPKTRGLKALLWSNHADNVHEIESKVLTWVFGYSNELPREVELIDHSHEALGVRYILLDTEKFPGVLPGPCSQKASFFLHTYFAGDLRLAKNAVGDVGGDGSRMGTPCPHSSFDSWYALPTLGSCHPTPFSCGVRWSRATVADSDKDALVEWTLGMAGGDCQGLAVQHTLYYHRERAQYKIMITHVIMDKDTTLSMFKL